MFSFASLLFSPRNTTKQSFGVSQANRFLLPKFILEVNSPRRSFQHHAQFNTTFHKPLSSQPTFHHRQLSANLQEDSMVALLILSLPLNRLQPHIGRSVGRRLRVSSYRSKLNCCRSSESPKSKASDSQTRLLASISLWIMHNSYSNQTHKPFAYSAFYRLAWCWCKNVTSATPTYWPPIGYRKLTQQLPKLATDVSLSLLLLLLMMSSRMRDKIWVSSFSPIKATCWSNELWMELSESSSILKFGLKIV